MNYTETNTYRNALVDLAVRLRPDFFLTLQPNRPFPVLVDDAKRNLRHFIAQLDRKLLGPRWSKIPEQYRTAYLAVPEGRRTRPGVDAFDGLHHHVLLRLPSRVDPRSSVLQSLAPAVWKRCVPSGSTDIQAIYDLSNLAGYVTKRFQDMNALGIEHFVIVGLSEPKPA
jgi:hypothetical protein